MTFRFLKEDHSYWLGDRRLPNVTTILESVGMADHRFSNEDAMLRGTYVHKATEMIDRGTLDWTTLDPILLPYCEAYQKFLATVNMETILLSERPMYHPQYLYAGTLDRVATINGVRSVVDIKSGSPHPATAVQIAAYRELAKESEGIPFLKGYSLHLRDDGTYRFDEIPDLSRNLQIFLAALSVVRWKEENL